MRGRFTPGAADEEWCERHLLARIHRYTVKRLRREIEPVERHDFMRFLFEWQHLTPDTRSEGRDALAAVLDQLEGYEAAAGAWEEDILPARVKAYREYFARRTMPRRQDRLDPAHRARARRGGPDAQHADRAAAARRGAHVEHVARHDRSAMELSALAQSVYDTLSQHGAMFFDELLADVRVLTDGTGKCAGRTGRRRPRELRQLRGLARIAEAGREAQCVFKQPARAIECADRRDGRRGALGAGEPASACIGIGTGAGA